MKKNENELPSNEDYSKLRKPSFTPDNNAKGITENRIAGINRVVGIEIHADGKPINHFNHFKLTQSAVRHHEFEIILAHDSLENRQSENLEDANKLLGKRFTVSFKYKDAETENNPQKSFVGIITSVAFSHHNRIVRHTLPPFLPDNCNVFRYIARYTKSVNYRWYQH